MFRKTEVQSKNRWKKTSHEVESVVQNLHATLYTVLQMVELLTIAIIMCAINICTQCVCVCVCVCVRERERERERERDRDRDERQRDRERERRERERERERVHSE